MSSLMNLEGIGKTYAEKILSWQKNALFSNEAEYVGPMIIEDAERLLALQFKILALEEQMEKLLEQSELGKTICSIPGFGIVCAAEITGEIGTAARFNSEAGLAIYLGMAPLDHSSGKQVGAKNPIQVNKRAKTAMMVGAAHNSRNVDESKIYYQKKKSEGKKHNQALRSLGRHLV
jgi:transposase